MIDANKRTQEYIAVRDKIKEREAAHKEELKPLKATLEKLGGILQQFMADTNTDAIRTDAGTAYLTQRSNASLADAEAFKRFVIDNKNFDLLDWKANATAVRDYVAANKALPPGVNLSTIQQVGVRRS